MLTALPACTFDDKLSEARFVDVPVVICDVRASACGRDQRNAFALIGYLGDLEFFDGSIGAPATEGQSLGPGGGCQFSGRLELPEFVSSSRLLAVDEDEWVAECNPGSALFSFEDGLRVHGTAVFRRGEQGCVVRTANFCG
jgi:hypothetical protein